MGMAYYEVPQKGFLKATGYKDIINPALDEIQQSMELHDIAREDFAKYLWDIEPYLAYLLVETKIPTDLVVLSLLDKELDIYDIFAIPLEALPEAADPKYGIVLLDDKSSANHQGVFFGNNFYYYNPSL